VPHVVTWATGDLRLLTSIDTWRASLRTMRGQPGPDRPWFFTADGQRVGEYFFHASYPFMHDGPRAYFLQIDQNEIHDRVHAPAAVEGERTFDDLARIVDFCLANGIDLRVVLTPSHAHQFEISRLVGDWDTVLASKRKLLALLTAKAAERGTAAPPLWDFMRYTTVTTEDLPPEGSHDELSRYWDPTHYKQAVGDGLLDVVVGASYSGLPADAGVRLTPQTIDAVLAADLEASARYEAAHTADIDQLTGLVADRRRELGLDAPH
jgi:hypothetical protein